MARLKSGSVKKTTTVLVTSVDLASADVTGVLPVANGGTGSGSYTDGQLLIGSTAGNTLAKATLTAGSNITITNGGGSITIAASSGGLTNFTESTATYSSQPYVALVPNNAGSNVNAVFSQKGTGYLSAHIPNGTSTGGNQRGSRSVDFGLQRGSASQVASGANAVLIGGASLTASGTKSIAIGGGSNTASSTGASVVGGEYNSATSSDAIVAGGIGNEATGALSSIIGGGFATTRTLYGCQARASGQFNAVGDAQTCQYLLRCETTNATPKVLTTNQASASTDNQVILPNNSSYTFRGMFNAHRTDSIGTSASFTFAGCVRRGANAASTTLVAAVTPTSLAADAGGVTWALAVTADTTNGGLAVTFTGEGSKTIRSVCVIETCEVTS